MKLSDRLPPIPFEGKWRWNVEPYTDTHIRITLRQKKGLFWRHMAGRIVDPFSKQVGWTIEDMSRSMIKDAEKKLILNSYFTKENDAR